LTAHGRGLQSRKGDEVREDGSTGNGQQLAQIPRKRSAQRRRREGRSGATCSAAFQGRQATRGGDRLQAVPLERKRSAQAREGRRTRHQAQQKKSAAPAIGGNDALRFASSDQLDAGDTIV
tara:strand:+ start:3245 stop:3607 length:363 start_codon:yes stop_codon:yes gene_type:complete